MTELTAERLRELLIYFPDAGLFQWRVSIGKVQIGDIPRCFQNYYVLQIDKKRYSQHRLAWLYTHGSWPAGQIDHINGDPRDNRLENLRDVSRYHNMQNKKSMKRKSSLPMGVTSNGIGQFHANIRIGTFQTVEEAREAYLSAKRLFHPGFHEPS